MLSAAIKNKGEGTYLSGLNNPGRGRIYFEINIDFFFRLLKITLLPRDSVLAFKKELVFTLSKLKGKFIKQQKQVALCFNN